MNYVNKPVTIVFCDLVSFSQGDDRRQAELIASLNSDVFTVLQPLENYFDPWPKILRLPTGDGMAIVLNEEEGEKRKEVFKIVRCFKDWSLRENAPLRIAVHKGNAPFIRDINNQTNVCGDTINNCQRILAATHRDQVLISNVVYETYFTYARMTDGYLTRGPYQIVAKHNMPLQVYVMYREEDGWNKAEPHPPFIDGVKARAKFIKDRLQELKSVTGELKIYEQSALSTFSLLEQYYPPEHPEYEYRGDLAAQRKLLDALVTRENVRLNLIINPRLTFQEDPLVAGRMEGLIQWMEAHVNDENIQWAEAETFGTNQLIVDGNFVIDGFSGSPYVGLTLSRVTYDPQTIGRGIIAFQERFDGSEFTDKTRVIERLKSTLISIRKSSNR